MKRPCVANGDGIGKDRAVGVQLKLVAQPDHDEQDGPTDPRGNGEGAQDIDVRAAGDDVPRRIGNGGRARYAGCHVNRLLRTTTTAARLKVKAKPTKMSAPSINGYEGKRPRHVAVTIKSA